MLKDAGRSGFFESYRSQMFAPLRLSDGSFGGVSQWAVETTKRVLDERRNGLIRDLAEGAGESELLGYR
jgi:hypothetical protein